MVPQLDGEDTHWMITYQKAQTIPEYHLASTINVPLAVATDNHWNILKDPAFQACLVAFRERHEASKGTTPKAGLPTKGVTLTTTLPYATSSSSRTAPTSEVDEVKEQVNKILDWIFALRVETVQELGFIHGTDQAMARALTSEFVRLQLIVGEDLNTSL